MAINVKAGWPLQINPNAPANSLERKQPAIDDGLDIPHPSRFYGRERLETEHDSITTVRLRPSASW